MASMRVGLSVLGLFMVTFAFGCESQMGGMKHYPPSQAGSPGQQSTKDGHSPMKHNTGSDKVIQ